jgi:hypothetical protein
MSYSQYLFSQDYQDRLLACVITVSLEFWNYGDIVRPEYFTGVDAFETAFQLKRYVEKYGKYPNFSTLMNTLLVKFERNNPDKASQLVDYVLKLTELDTDDWEGVRVLVKSFAKECSLFSAQKKIYTAHILTWLRTEMCCTAQSDIDLCSYCAV